MLNQTVASPLILARRRRPARSRPRRHPRQALPDWVWGLMLGLAAVLIGGLVFLVAGGGLGGGGGGCDKPLVPLETSDISASGLAQEDAGLARVIEAADRGAMDEVESAFYGPVHNFTHNVDPPIREKDEALAKQLCEAVIKIEEDLVANPSPLDISLDARRIREYAEAIAEELRKALGGAAEKP